MSYAVHSVLFNMQDRVLTVDGVTVVPTLDSDWFELTPGTHTVEKVNGLTGMTVYYRERWL